MTCILLYDRVFERYCLYFADGTRVDFPSFNNATFYLLSFPQLREVPVNSKPGQRILRRIGSQTTQL